MNKKKSFWSFLTIMLVTLMIMLPQLANAEDGDKIIVKTDDNFTLTYRVISEAEKTVELYDIYPRRTIVSLNIPETVNGYTVTVLGSVFYYNNELGHVSLPSTLKSIGALAFEGCSSLTKISLPEGLTEIGHSAFRGCRKLANITFPSTLVTIGYDAFRGCNLFTEIIVPEGVTTIGESAFYTSEDGGTESWLSRLVIPSTVTSMEAITGKTTVDELILKCPEVPSESFSGAAITDLVIDGVETINGFAFMNCLTLQKVTMSGALRTIGPSAFRGCIAIKDIEVPEGVTTIDDSAFDLAGGNYRGQGSLNSVIIPSTVTFMGKLFGNTPVESLMIKCKSISKEAFEDSAIKNLTLDGVEEVGYRAFYGSDKLTSATFGDKLRSLGEGAFQGCNYLEEAILPETVTEIGDDCFLECYFMKKAYVPDNFEVFPAGLFFNCQSLNGFTIPSKITKIGRRAFYYCQSLEAINIPDGVTEIGEEAFAKCKKIQKIILPSHLSVMGEDVFNEASALTEIYALNPDPKIEFQIWWQPFYYWQYNNSTLYVPGASLEAYKKTTPWSYFKKISEIPMEYSLVGNVSLPNANGQFVAGNTAQVRIAVANTGTNDYKQGLDALLMKKEGEEWTVIRTETVDADVPVGGEKTYDVIYDNLETDGIYRIIVWYKSLGEFVQMCVSENFQMISPSYDLKARISLNDMQKDGDNRYHIIGSDIRCTVNITNPSPYEYKDKLLVKIVTEDGKYAGNVEIDEVTIEAGDTWEQEVTLSEDELVRGSSYAVEVYYARRGVMEAGGTSAKFKVVKYGQNNLSGGVHVVSPIVTKEGAVQVGDQQQIYVNIESNSTADYVGVMDLVLMHSVDGMFRPLDTVTKDINVEAMRKSALDYTFTGLETGETYCVEVYYYVFDEQVRFGKSSIWRMVEKNPYDIGRGDVNGDGAINTADIVEVINYIMGNQSDSFDFTAADANGDGKVNEADIDVIVNMIMAK